MRRSGLLVALLLAALARDVRADAFVPPPGKRAVTVTVGFEGLDAHDQYTFVVAPNACYPDDAGEVDYTVVDGPDTLVDRSDHDPERGDCAPRRLFALPRDIFPRAPDGALPNLDAEARSVFVERANSRVLSAAIAGDDAWWVADDLPLTDIVDLHRAEISGGALSLTPTRVRFDFGEDRVVERAYYRGKRPRIPRAEEIPPPSELPPPPPGAEPPAAPPPATAPPAPPAPPPAPRAAPTAPEPEDMPEATWPLQLVLGVACLIIALAAGLALRRRR